MIKSESITKIAPALIKFNSEVSRITKDAANPFLKNKYATLDQIIEQVRPVLSENKLSVMQNVISNDGFMTIKTFLLHESGEWFESEGTTLRLAKNDPQGAGAGITYARRYDLCAFLSLNTGEDDDGNGIQPNPDGPEEPLITPRQVGNIKTKAMEYANARKRIVEDVYGVLKIDDITQLSEKQAKSIIKQLDIWINAVNKEQGEK